MNGEKYLSALLLLCFALASGSAAAAEIYHWIDDDGVTHFSDTPPVNGEEARSLHVNPSNPADYDPAHDPYSIVNQAKRMNDKLSALEEEKERRARERREALQNAPRYHAPRYDGWRYSYWPRYYAPVRPVHPSPNQNRTVRRQANTLEALNLTGPRPYSINSGAHAARVKNSRKFLQTVTKPVPRGN
jgi:hypothetical protein